jgi:hypothetical protein
VKIGVEISRKGRTHAQERYSVIVQILSVLMLVLVFVGPTHGQTSAEAKGVAGPFHYDSAKEITVSGIVVDVVSKPPSGTVPGWHLLIATRSGLVDASLGRFGLQGADALSVASGQQVEVTGAIRTINHTATLLARVVKVESKTVVLRNVHGVLLPPRARENVERALTQQGGLE